MEPQRKLLICVPRYMTRYPCLSIRGTPAIRNCRLVLIGYEAARKTSLATTPKHFVYSAWYLTIPPPPHRKRCFHAESRKHSAIPCPGEIRHDKIDSHYDETLVFSNTLF